MKTLFLTAAATILLASTATAVIVPESHDSPQVSYTLNTPGGRIVMTCTEPHATTTSASASTAFPVMIDTGPVLIGAEPGDCVFAPASN
jgi:hypothetical protein